MVTSVMLQDSSKPWVEKQQQILRSGIKKMGLSILATARVITPKDEGGDLMASGRLFYPENGCTVVFGGGNIQYAQYQHRGMRKDGTRVVRHYTTPGTGKSYLKKAGDKVVEKGLKVWL